MEYEKGLAPHLKVQALRQLLRRWGIKQTEIAALTGFTKVYICYCLTGVKPLSPKVERAILALVKQRQARLIPSPD